MSGLLGLVSEPATNDTIDSIKGPASRYLESDIDFSKQKFETEQIQAHPPPPSKTCSKTKKRKRRMVKKRRVVKKRKPVRRPVRRPQRGRGKITKRRSVAKRRR